MCVVVCADVVAFIPQNIDVKTPCYPKDQRRKISESRNHDSVTKCRLRNFKYYPYPETYGLNCTVCHHGRGSVAADRSGVTSSAVRSTPGAEDYYTASQIAN